MFMLRSRRIRAGRFVLTALLAVGSVLAGCDRKRTAVHRAFYEWRSDATYAPDDLQRLADLRIDRLYLRLFDVQLNEAGTAPVPISVAHLEPGPVPGIEIIPTVYVTNEVMKRVMNDAQLSELASNIARKIESRMDALGSPNFAEVQIDCDWTASSKTAYFNLLRELKTELPDHLLSCTIRLHQIRYRVETGIPPVDRGMLMAYNVGRVTDPEETNSIFTEEEVMKYLGTLDEYPLPLDAALPVFSWGVRFHFGNYAALIDNIDHETLRQNRSFEQIDEHLFRALRSATLNGTEIAPGDIIRIEEPDRDEVLNVAEHIASALDEPTITVALYRYDPAIMERYDAEIFRRIFFAFE